jgi:hypothetical protein
MFLKTENQFNKSVTCDDDGSVTESDGAVRVPRRRHLRPLQPSAALYAVHLHAVRVAGQLAQTAAQDEEKVTLLQNNNHF